MSAPPKPGREVVIRLTDKAKAMDRGLEHVSEGELKTGDLAVLWFLCTSMDNQSGECVRRYDTIAQGCNISRATAVRAISRLKGCGLIEKRERFYRTSKGKTASAFRLCTVGLAAADRNEKAADAEEVGSKMNRGSAHQCTSMVSHHSRIPSVDQPSTNPRGKSLSEAQDDPLKPSPDTDWAECKRWLSKQGQYTVRWGHGAEQLALDDINRLRWEKGDRPLLRAIEIAKTKRLYGKPLSDFLKRTYPDRRRMNSRRSKNG